MLTFLFLVSLTATTLLLLSVAAEEALRVTRTFLTGRAGSAKLRTSDAEVVQISEHSRHASSAQRTRARCPHRRSRTASRSRRVTAPGTSGVPRS